MLCSNVNTCALYWASEDLMFHFNSLQFKNGKEMPTLPPKNGTFKARLKSLDDEDKLAPKVTLGYTDLRTADQSL